MSLKPELSRREFLARSTQFAAGALAAAALASCTSTDKSACAAGRVIGANDRINMAVIGIRGRGMNLAEGFVKIPNVSIKTLCDIDGNLFAERIRKIEGIQGFAPKTSRDLRCVYEDKDIDVVAIATPNHWHALATIWACQAGKHVYVEKPCSHNVWEGRKMIEAARRYDRLVEVGFQNRSLQNVRQAMKFLHDGGIGEVYMARGMCFKPRDTIGKCPDGLGKFEYYVWNEKAVCYDSEYMKKVDYDLWLGPAPKRPFNYNRFHYNWHWNWDYGNGDIGNQGPHQFDVARWGLNKNEHPVNIHSAGGYFGPPSDQQTPNTQMAVFKYADGKILQFEVRGLYTNEEAALFQAKQDQKDLYEKIGDGITVGNLFFGTKGWMYLNGSNWKTFLGRKGEPGPCSQAVEQAADPRNPAGSGADDHFVNFVKAVRSGKREDLTCDIETGFMSTTLPHLANISYRLGRDVTFDGKKEKFVNDWAADKLLTRKYRSPYIVPEKV
jgi:predicted dehydrogenase